MGETVIKIENLYKEYKLGVISHGTVYRDMQSWWARVRGKEDPNSLISTHHSNNTDKDSFLALEDISFEVKAGERVGIIGKNGAGKSTLLKIISRITSPSRGEIKIKGRIGSLLEVGTGFHPELTGRENIYLNGAILGMNRHEIGNKLEEIIDFAGIEKHIDTPVKRYSSGMNVRLGFAVAAHLEPEILVVDEVLAVGDIEFQKKALGKMEDVSKSEGRTVLFVSHNLGAISVLCTKVIYIDKGKIVYNGVTTEGIELYQKNNLNKVLNYYDFNIKDSERYGSGKARFKSLNILSAGSKGSNHIFTGDNVLIKTSIKAFEELRDVIIAVIIYSIDGYRIIDVNTAIKGDQISFKENEEKNITFILKNMLLKPGEYLIGLWTGKPGEDIDGIKYALKFSVGIKSDRIKYTHIYPGVYQCDYAIKEFK